MKDPEPKPAGTWDFRGACAPEPLPDGGFRKNGMSETFTLGCFQWVPLARGKGTKAGRVVYRVKGHTSAPAAAFAAAEAYCVRKNSERA